MINPTEDEVKYFAKDLATVIVFFDTTLPNFFDEIRMIIDEVKKWAGWKTITTMRFVE